MFCVSPPTSCPGATWNEVPANDRRHDQGSLFRLRIDLLAQQPHDVEASLGVSQDHDRAGRGCRWPDSAATHRARPDRRGPTRRRSCRECLPNKPADGHRAVDRRIDLAHLIERGSLQIRDADLVAGNEITVERRVVADRRIHVEAIERRIDCHLVRLHGQRAIGGHLGERRRVVAGVGEVAATDPVGRGPGRSRSRTARSRRRSR